MSFSEDVVLALEEWHEARESANRHNRNLLQYGAAIATVFGIAVGFGGIASVAISTGDGNGTPYLVAAGIIGAIGFVLGALGAFAIVRAFRARRSAEERAAQTLRVLIRHDPERFMPREELTRERAAESA